MSNMKMKAINSPKRLPYRERMKRLRREMWHYRKLYPLMIFGVVFFAVFAYAPMYGIQLAFKDYSIAKGITGSEWVNFDNFKILFGRTEFWNVIKNTIVISLLKLIFTFPVPILLAIGLNELVSNKLKRTLQVIFTLPHFLSWVTIAGIMLALFATDGAINGMLEAVGGSSIKWLSSGIIFRIILIVTTIWKEAGWSCIIYMAAIASIDPSLYESAKIDGANRLKCALHITWPSILGTAAILLILQVGNALNGDFDQIFNLYNPTVYSTADIIDTYIYRISFVQSADYSMSTAVGLFKGITNCVLLLVANFVIGKFDKDAKLI